MTPYILPIRCFRAYAECAHTAVFAEVVLVLAGVEEVLRQFRFARPQAKPALPRHPTAGQKRVRLQMLQLQR